jgi:hypothetical protein
LPWQGDEPDVSLLPVMLHTPDDGYRFSGDVTLKLGAPLAQLVGCFADDVNACLRDRLASDRPALEWTTERDVAGTPVDVAGDGDRRLVAVELEWRRADPSDNAAKLFRHLSEGSIDADHVVVVHLFTRYYDLASGGHSAKRKSAEFVGEVAA